MHEKVESYLTGAQKWKAELRDLRRIALDCGLTEEWKWGHPCYTFRQKNVVILQGFKDFCALLFPKGALLRDPEGILEKPGANTQAARRIPFTSVEDVSKREAALKKYIENAIEVERSDLKVNYKETSDFSIPEEFQDVLNNRPALRSAFEKLAPGRQRGYLLYFSAPKHARTRISRIEKCAERILDGKGLRD